MLGGAARALAGIAVAVVLGACGTTGNFTRYYVQCKPDVNETIAVMRGVAGQMADFRGQKPRELGSDENFFGLSLDRTRQSETVIEFRLLVGDWHPDAVGVNNFYRIEIRRGGDTSEDAEIIGLRSTLEDKIKGSACPVFVRTITYSQPMRLAEDDPMDWARPLMKIAAG